MARVSQLQFSSAGHSNRVSTGPRLTPGQARSSLNAPLRPSRVAFADTIEKPEEVLATVDIPNDDQAEDEGDDEDDDDDEDEDEDMFHQGPASSRGPRGSTMIPFFSVRHSRSSKASKASTDMRNMDNLTAGRLSPLFDDNGSLADGIHSSWALKACQSDALHETTKLSRRTVTLPARVKANNARQVLDKDKERTKSTIRKALETHIMSQPLDLQKLRHRRLLMEPLQAADGMIDHFQDLCDNQDEHYIHLKKERAPVMKGMQVFKKTVERIMQASYLGLERQRSHEALLSQPQEIKSGPITNAQRKALKNVFKYYTLRVAGPSKLELMQRCTWFKFLHHCGLLGKDGGVSFSYASNIFATFADGGLDPPKLTFATWFNALQKLLRGPDFFSSQPEFMTNLFGVYIKRCEERIASAVSLRSPERSARVAPANPRGTLSRPNEIEYQPIKNGSSNGDKMMRSIGVAGWPSDIAEEQMGDPEVITLLHEYARPLRKLFLHCARLGPPPTREYRDPMTIFKGELGEAITVDSEVEYDLELSDEENRPSYPTDEHIAKNKRKLPDLGRPSSAGSMGEFATDALDIDAREDIDNLLQRTSEDSSSSRASSAYRRVATTRRPFRERMSCENFEAMMRDLHLFPEIVQRHSMKQHIAISMARRGIGQLSYGAFVECLCRIAFVYLCVYGNSVQQAAPSQVKCVWLFSMLRARCREYGPEKGYPPELTGDEQPGRDGEDLWTHRKVINIDTIPLRKLILFRMMDIAFTSYSLEGTGERSRARNLSSKKHAHRSTLVGQDGAR